MALGTGGGQSLIVPGPFPIVPGPAPQPEAGSAASLVTHAFSLAGSLSCGDKEVVSTHRGTTGRCMDRRNPTEPMWPGSRTPGPAEWVPRGHGYSLATWEAHICVLGYFLAQETRSLWTGVGGHKLLSSLPQTQVSRPLVHSGTSAPLPGSEDQGSSGTELRGWEECVWEASEEERVGRPPTSGAWGDRG